MAISRGELEISRLRSRSEDQLQRQLRQSQAADLVERIEAAALVSGAQGGVFPGWTEKTRGDAGFRT
jgi:hypothetical protein